MGTSSGAQATKQVELETNLKHDALELETEKNLETNLKQGDAT